MRVAVFHRGIGPTRTSPSFRGSPFVAWHPVFTALTVLETPRPDQHCCRPVPGEGSRNAPRNVRRADDSNARPACLQSVGVSFAYSSPIVLAGIQIVQVTRHGGRVPSGSAGRARGSFRSLRGTWPAIRRSPVRGFPLRPVLTPNDPSCGVLFITIHTADRSTWWDLVRTRSQGNPSLKEERLRCSIH